MQRRYLIILVFLIVFAGLSALVLRAILVGDPAVQQSAEVKSPPKVSEPAPDRPEPATSVPPTEPVSLGVLTDAVERAPAAPVVPESSAASGNGNVGQVQNNLGYTQYKTDGLAVRSIASDGSETWIGTTGGVVRHQRDKNEVTVFDNERGLLSNLVRHVAIDKTLGVLVSTFGGGLSIFDRTDQTWRTLSIAEGLPDPFVQATLRSKSGDLWVATWSGACQVQGGAVDELNAWKCHTAASSAGGLPSNRVYALSEDSFGGIWAGTEAGIARYQNGVWRGWTHADGLGADPEDVTQAIEAAPGSDGVNVVREVNSNINTAHPSPDSYKESFQIEEAARNPQYATSLLIDDDGTVWVGTWGGGLARFQNELWRNYTTNDGLLSDHVHAVQKSIDGRIMIATNAGLSILSGESLSTMTKENGLISDVVLTLTALPNGAFWAGGIGGAVYYPGMPKRGAPNGS